MPAATFLSIIAHLCRTIAAHQPGTLHPRRMQQPVIELVYHRLRRIAARFAQIVAQLEAGTLRQPVRRAAPPAGLSPAEPRPRPATDPAAARPPAKRWPHRLRSDQGWLFLFATGVGAHGGHLAQLLATEDMQDLLDRAPQLRRLIRPIMTMFGIEPQPPHPDTPPAERPPPPKRRLKYANALLTLPPLIRRPRPPGPPPQPDPLPQPA